jgi:predicted transcriptional regulator
VTKNLTLAIDDDLLDKARVLAAMRRTTVNAMVRGFLEREIERETLHVTRAEAWGRMFQVADADASRRDHRLRDGERLFDRELFYEEVMRERGLL